MSDMRLLTREEVCNAVKERGMAAWSGRKNERGNYSSRIWSVNEFAGWWLYTQVPYSQTYTRNSDGERLWKDAVVDAIIAALPLEEKRLEFGEPGVTLQRSLAHLWGVNDVDRDMKPLE